MYPIFCLKCKAQMAMVNETAFWCEVCGSVRDLVEEKEKEREERQKREDIEIIKEVAY